MRFLSGPEPGRAPMRAPRGISCTGIEIAFDNIRRADHNAFQIPFVWSGGGSGISNRNVQPLTPHHPSTAPPPFKTPRWHHQRGVLLQGMLGARRPVRAQTLRAGPALLGVWVGTEVEDEPLHVQARALPRKAQPYFAPPPHPSPNGASTTPATATIAASPERKRSFSEIRLRRPPGCPRADDTGSRDRASRRTSLRLLDR